MVSIVLINNIFHKLSVFKSIEDIEMIVKFKVCCFKSIRYLIHTLVNCLSCLENVVRKVFDFFKLFLIGIKRPVAFVFYELLKVGLFN